MNTIRMISVLVTTILLFGVLRAVSAEVGEVQIIDCESHPYVVRTEAELNAAIECYNALPSIPATITMTADIVLTQPTTVIDNVSVFADLTINGNGHALDGANSQRGLTIAAETDVFINGLTIRNGRADGVDDAGSGGAILNRGTLTIYDSTFSHNEAAGDSGISAIGGAIFNPTGTLVVTDSLFVGNNARLGGSIANNDGTVTISRITIANSSASEGGGIRNAEVMTINSSSIYSNAATFSGGGISNRFGNLTVNNSTISSNTATNNGGGLENDQGTLHLNNSTVTDNTGGGLSNSNGFGTSFLHLRNTIIANTVSGGDCRFLTPGSPTTNINNLIEGAGGQSCGISDGEGGSIVGQDPALDLLLSNGGPTATHEPLENSPAIDAGNSAVCANAPINALDQRGVSRPQGPGCDIGAVEVALPDCTVQPYPIDSETTLNAAISCFNAATSGATFEATLYNDVTLTTPTAKLDNKSGVTFLLVGIDGFPAVDGADSVRLFDVAADTSVHIEKIVLRNGFVLNGSGGAIYNVGRLTLIRMRLENNQAEVFGGAIYNDGSLQGGSVTFSGNAAMGDGGAIYTQNDAYFTRSTFSDNSAAYGGAISNNGQLEVRHSTFSDNATTGDGGAIANQESARFRYTTFSGNSADFGGAISNSNFLSVGESTFSDNAAQFGGALYNESSLYLWGSTLNGNSADEGGGIANDFDALIDNTTLSGNHALKGGGISTIGTLTLDFSSVISNSADLEGGGIHIAESGTAGKTTLTNAIIAHSTNGDCVIDADGEQLNIQANNLIFDAGANACDIADGSDGSIVGQDPLVEPLATNSGKTQTHALSLNSPAIDEVTFEACASVVDQRDVKRTWGTGCDIGAYELVQLDDASDEMPIGSAGDFVAVLDLCADGQVPVNPDDDSVTLLFTENITRTPPIPVFTCVMAGRNMPVTLTVDGNNKTLSGGDETRLFDIPAGQLVTINNLTLLNGNTTDNDSDERAPDPTHGGAIRNAGTLTLTNSAIVSSTATVGGAIANSGTLNLINSTLSGNSNTESGGALHSAGTLTVINSTLANNSAVGMFSAAETATIRNTILAGNSIGDCLGVSDIFSSIIADGSCGTTVSNPLLGALADNGGGTLTHAITASTPAHNSGDNAFCPVTDQRGFARNDGQCDMGAFELNAVPTAVMLTQFTTRTHVLPLLLLAISLALTWGTARLQRRER